MSAAPARSDPDVPRRLKALVSVYACEPGRGSEPGIGWNTARELAKYHDVWAVTTARHRPQIEAELAQRPVTGLRVVYYDLPDLLRTRLGYQLRYYLWQLGLYRFAKRLHRQVGFDVTHHVSYVRCWSPSLLGLLPVPFVWGPVGGGETMPPSFLKGLGQRVRREERTRTAVLRLASIDPFLRWTARRSTLTVANSTETAARVRGLGARRVRIYPESGLDELAFLPPPPAAPGEPDPGATVCFASMTRLLYWKGVHLGLEAFARLGNADAVYWVVGEGPERERLAALARRLGIAERVRFFGSLSRLDWMRILHRCDALVHPCIFNSGGQVSLEAMAAGRPVICLDRGGIATQVTDATGFKVAAENPAQAVAGLAAAMRAVLADASLRAAMGRRARERAERYFRWEVRAQVLDRVYREAVALAARPAPSVREDEPDRYLGPPLASAREPELSTLPR